MRRAANAQPAPAEPVAMSEALRAALREAAPRLGGAATQGGPDVGGMFGNAVNAGIHAVEEVAHGAIGDPISMLGGVIEPSLLGELGRLAATEPGRRAIMAELHPPEAA
jgi:hypothetical protein